MTHPLVSQLYFTRTEWLRALADVSTEDGMRRFEPINPLGWMVGHLAWQEHRYWMQRGMNKVLVPEIDAYGFGAPASSPDIQAMWQAWHTITAATNEYLERITPEMLNQPLPYDERPTPDVLGKMLLRQIYHYWYHLGESQAVRQMLGHQNLPTFIGNMKDVSL
jgi:hypothetical protein